MGVKPLEGRSLFGDMRTISTIIAISARFFAQPDEVSDLLHRFFDAAQSSISGCRSGSDSMIQCDAQLTVPVQR